MATVMYVGTNAGLGQPAAPVWRVVCGVASGEAWCVACGVAWGGGGPCRVACGVMVVCGVWRVVWYAVWCAAWRVACGVVRGEEDRPPPSATSMLQPQLRGDPLGVVYVACREVRDIHVEGLGDVDDLQHVPSTPRGCQSATPPHRPHREFWRCQNRQQEKKRLMEWVL